MTDIEQGKAAAQTACGLATAHLVSYIAPVLSNVFDFFSFCISSTHNTFCILYS